MENQNITAQPYTQQVEEQPPYSGLCVAGFVTALLGLFPIDLILSIVGIVSCNKHGKRGKGLGIAGIIISILTGFVVIIMIAVLVLGIGTYLDRANEAADSLKAHNDKTAKAVQLIDDDL